MINYISRWKYLGAALHILNCHHLRGQIKFVKDSIITRPEESVKRKWANFNFLGIDLSLTGISCLDIEGTKNSVPEFKERLKSCGIDLSDLFYENSLNNGLHIYFRKKPNASKKNYKGNKVGNVLFDILNTGRAFTSPSYFGEKKYQWGDMNPFTINSLEDIQEVPDWINQVFIN